MHLEKKWHDKSLAVNQRVALLLSEMTLEEKVAQLGSRWLIPADEQLAADFSEHRMAPSQDPNSEAAKTPLGIAAKHGLGQLSRNYGSQPISARAGSIMLAERQRIVLAGSRLGIPAIVHEECASGFLTFGATIYPAPLGLAATFNPRLVEEMAYSVAQDMRNCGVHQALGPVLDVTRDYRWGRVEETFGEDPTLVSEMGVAFVGALERAGLVATAKHFVGYSASREARNHGPVSMGRRELLEVMLPPFEAAIKLGGARSVMPSYTDLDGVPSTADSWLLTDILRETWKFEGTVVADYGAIEMLHTVHRVSGNRQESAAMAISAGLDVELPNTDCTGDEFVAAVKRGEFPETFIDRAAGRVLKQKIELGLLDSDWDENSAVETAASLDLDSQEHRRLARDLAEQSMVLLKAGAILPIEPDGEARGKRIAVVGPTADNLRNLLGDYAFPNHITRDDSAPVGLEGATPLEALRAEFSNSQVSFEPGCSVSGVDSSGIPAAVRLVEDSDFCVAFLGDRAGLFGSGTSGEGCDAADLRLPGVQAELLEALLATGKPIVLVMISGRPYALGEFDERLAGLIQAFFPGIEGAGSIAGILSGRINPSGRLPVQIPKHPGHQPSTYLQPPLGGGESTWVTVIDSTPLYPFGYGESYSQMSLKDIRVDSTECQLGGTIVISCAVTNLSRRRGSEVVQIYLEDPIAETVRPVRRMIAFAKVDLDPGESKRILFSLHTDLTSFIGANLRRIVEPGLVRLHVGRSVRDIDAVLSITLNGEKSVLSEDREMLAKVDVLSH